MAQVVKLDDIKMEVLKPSSDSTPVSMLTGEISGAGVYSYTIKSNNSLSFEGQNKFIRIWILCKGAVSFSAEGNEYTYSEKAMFVTKPESSLDIKATADSSLLEIRWDMNESDLEDLATSTTQFPIAFKYADAPQYRDFFKSETTISRALLKQAVIPRFALGSVEAKADDLVGQHAHPLLDQFFFSFEENDMDLLIDCRICPMKGNTLLHIPLGSNHGVIARGEQKMHYLWIDCTPQEQKAAAVAYLDEVHKPTGEKQTL